MKLLTKVLLLAIAFSLTAGYVWQAKAVTLSLNVPAGQEIIQRINLTAEDKIKVTFLVLGQTSNPLLFSIVYPNGTSTDFGDFDQQTISFSSYVKGVCELHFDNRNASDDKLVSLNYEVEHQFLGIPQPVFIIILITLILLAILAGYLIMGKYA
jgi:hypothetical protein